jgi:hypothetical protein
MDKILSYEEVLWKRMSSEAKDLLFDFESRVLNHSEDTFTVECSGCYDESGNIEKYLELRGYNVYHEAYGTLTICI